MSSNVIIKSFKNGIRLILDSEADFDDLLISIGQKFYDVSAFFGDCTLALSFSGRALSEEEEVLIVNEIKENSNINIACILSEDEETNRVYMKALCSAMDQIDDSEKCRVIKGSVINGEVIEADEGVIVLGDVNPGCSVISGGSIIVLGSLYGIAKAGRDSNNKSCFVISLEMSAEFISIGDINFIPAVKPKWGIKHKIKPEIAVVKNDAIVFEGLSKSSLEALYETV